MEMKVIFLLIHFHAQIPPLSTRLLFFGMIKYLREGFSRKEKKKDYSGTFAVFSRICFLFI